MSNYLDFRKSIVVPGADETPLLVGSSLGFPAFARTAWSQQPPARMLGHTTPLDPVFVRSMVPDPPLIGWQADRTKPLWNEPWYKELDTAYRVEFQTEGPGNDMANARLFHSARTTAPQPLLNIYPLLQQAPLQSILQPVQSWAK